MIGKIAVVFGLIAAVVTVLLGLIKLFCEEKHRGQKRRSRTEKRVLVRAEANGGEIHVLGADQLGCFVRIGNYDYFDGEDPAVQAEYMEILDSLVQKGLVKHIGGAVYSLTAAGFKKTTKLKKRLKFEM